MALTTFVLTSHSGDPTGLDCGWGDFVSLCPSSNGNMNHEFNMGYAWYTGAIILMTTCFIIFSHTQRWYCSNPYLHSMNWLLSFLYARLHNIVSLFYLVSVSLNWCIWNNVFLHIYLFTLCSGDSTMLVSIMRPRASQRPTEVRINCR